MFLRIFPRPLAYLACLVMLFATVARAELQDGSYIIDTIEFADPEDAQLGTLNAEGIAQTKASTWVVLDLDARRIEAYSTDGRDVRIGTFTEDMTSFTNEGETQAVKFEVMDDSHFATEVPAFLPLHVTFRKVATNSPELAAIRAARQAEFDRRDKLQAKQQKLLEKLKDERVALDLRLPLGEKASIAFAANYDLEQGTDWYQLVAVDTEDLPSNYLEIFVYAPEKRAAQLKRFANDKAIMKEWENTPYLVTEDAIYWVDPYGNYRLNAQTELDGITYYFNGVAAPIAEYKKMLSTWHSLDAPVDGPEFLREVTGTAYANAVGQADFDKQIESAFAELSKPEALMTKTNATPGENVAFADAKVFITDRQDFPDAMAAMIVAGTPAEVLKPFLPYGGNGQIAFAMHETDCMALAAFNVDYGTGPYSLVLQQSYPGAFAKCLAYVATLSAYGLDRVLSTHVDPGSLAHFRKFGSVSEIRQGARKEFPQDSDLE